MSFVNLLGKIRNRVVTAIRIRRTKFHKWYRSFYSDQHQLTSTTSEDRYPELFQETRMALGKTGEVNLLSFGCSTGEECFSLKRYFPAARITGVDINTVNLEKATRKNRFPDIQFLLSTPVNIHRAGPYQAIFCLSVLCRWEDTKDMANCERIYPFAKFQEAVTLLAGELEPGGLLVIYNSNFRFEDTVIFSQFEIVPAPSITDSGFVHKFDSQNNRIFTEHKHCIYRKKLS